ncbi:MAG TPA: hypothetical protein VFY90_11095, partial [Tepidiformaceae bacterium]|nr:hypothetical protein [Tepidiformaceae bacterium]
MEQLRNIDRAKAGAILAIVVGAVGMAVTAGIDNKLLRAASFVLLALGILSVIVAVIAATLGRRLAARPAQKRLAQYIAVAALVVLALLAPWWVDNVPHFSLLKLSVAITFMMVILGLNLLTGFGGQISLGHSAFFAIGGYTTAIMINEWDISWGYSIPVAGILAGTVGFLFGFPALRLKGLYLALATLALAVCVSPIAKKFEGLTGGVQG